MTLKELQNIRQEVNRFVDRLEAAGSLVRSEIKIAQERVNSHDKFVSRIPHPVDWETYAVCQYKEIAALKRAALDLKSVLTSNLSKK